MGNVFVVTHKKFNMELPKNYNIIQVGKYNTKQDLGYISDDTGDNIANKNLNYCELTGMYWVWKNYKLRDYIGFCHYRRYLSSPKRIGKIINDVEIKKLLEKYDVILPEKFYFKYTVGENYYCGGSGKKEDLKKLRNVINDLSPEYIECFDNVLNRYGSSYCNIFIMNINNFKQYSEWLYKILNKLEEYIDLKNYTVAEARIYGYLSEILLNVWIEKNNLKKYETSIIYTEISKKQYIRKKIQNSYYKIRAIKKNTRSKK